MTEMTLAKTNSIAIPAEMGVSALMSSQESYAQIDGKLRSMIDSGALPSSVKSTVQAAIIIEHGARLGLGMLESLQSITMVMGSPALSAKATLALILRVYGADAVRITEYSDIACVATVTVAGKRHEVEYTMEMARRAGLANKDTWKKFPRDMLRAKLVRDVRFTYFPMLNGFNEREIAEDSREHAGTVTQLGDLTTGGN